MKKLIALFTVLIFVTTSFAQAAKVEGNKAQLQKTLANNYIEFIMPSTTTAGEVEKSAQYYTDYFTVEFNDKTKVAKIKLIENDDSSRRVINRFLLSTNVRNINFDGKEYTIMEFYSTFLK